MAFQIQSLTVRRVITAALAVSTSWSLVGPAQAFAADGFRFNDGSTDYTEAYSSEDGSFAWDGGDNFSLNNYDGAGWSAWGGDANVSVEGTNDVEGSIAVTDGDLTITGEGELNVTPDDSSSLPGGIHANNGDVNIVDTTVSVESSNASGMSGAISAAKGDVNIEGAKVEAVDTLHGDGVFVSEGSVNIKDSSVTAAGGDHGKGIEAVGRSEGSSRGDDGSAAVNIDGSSVTAEGENGAIVAWNIGYGLPGSSTKGGEINITNSSITSPDGALVQDLLINRGAEDMIYKGQAIGTGAGVIDSWDSADIAKKVTIEAGGASAANASSASTTSTTRSNHGSVASAKLTPATSDNTSSVAAIAAVAASVVLGGIALKLRKQQ